MKPQNKDQPRNWKIRITPEGLVPSTMTFHGTKDEALIYAQGVYNGLNYLSIGRVELLAS